jgi:hypothetical protein
MLRLFGQQAGLPPALVDLAARKAAELRRVLLAKGQAGAAAVPGAPWLSAASPHCSS